MNKSKSTKVNPETIGLNPLTITEFVIKATEINISGSFKIEGDIKLPSIATVEYESSTKIYNKAEHRIFVSKLKPAAKSLFIWLLYELEISKDYIWINKNRYMNENLITSINTYKSAIAELTRYCVIYPMANKKDVYWINPRLMFNGNRITKYPDKVKLI